MAPVTAVQVPALVVSSWLLLASLASAVNAQPLPPELTSPVNDFAGVIDDESARALDTLIRSLERASGDVVVVATVETVAPYADVREYAVKMFENHGRGVGQKDKDNGLLVLIAVQDRRVWIEVGYDLEEFITDGFAGQTSRDDMVPHFRQGDYGAGALAGVSRLAARIADARGVTLDGLPERQSSTPGEDLAGTIVAVVVFLFLASIFGGLRGRRRGFRGGHWGNIGGWHSGVGPFGGGFGGGFRGGGFGGGGFGGGFGGFGGGGSGGGGGGGSW